MGKIKLVNSFSFKGTTGRWNENWAITGLKYDNQIVSNLIFKATYLAELCFC